MNGDSLSTSAPGGSAPRESRTAQFYQATEPYVARSHDERLRAYTQNEWDKPPVGDDDQEYRVQRSWRDNPLYNHRL
jgi:hypothetical protein